MFDVIGTFESTILMLNGL